MAVKRTHRHKGALKPGTYFLEGKDNKAKNGNLSFEGVIGDFLVNKGLATTEDNCTYILNCCEGTIQNIRTTTEIEICNVIFPLGSLLSDIIEALVACEASGIVNVQTINGITGDGSGANKVKWGGALVENTTIDGVSTYSITFLNPTQFTVQTDGASAKGLLRVSGLVSQPSTLRHIKDTDSNVFSAIDLDVDSTYGLYHNDANGIVGFFIFPDETDVENNLALRTKGIRDGTRTVGMVPILQDTGTGEFEWNSLSSTITYPGPYDNDSQAGVNGVAIGSPYYKSANCDYGGSEGDLRIRLS